VDSLFVQYLGAIAGLVFLGFSVRQNQKSGYRKIRPTLSVLEESFLWSESLATRPAATVPAAAGMAATMAPPATTPVEAPMSMSIETGQLLNLSRALAEGGAPSPVHLPNMAPTAAPATESSVRSETTTTAK
jgi:hypothetical protein